MPYYEYSIHKTIFVEDSLRNRTKIVIILLGVMALAGLMYIDSIEHMKDYDPSVAYRVGDEIIDTYVVGDEHYLFLPSWAGMFGEIVYGAEFNKNIG
ncbi:hypothetical protein [Lacrimispora saccharolytica]|uniref:hypothetical protein n=1 Tax=Lacrimispora saccharolytica TaxID=84030 RepID=UPI00265D51A5|nr:hypothetical protein [Lacrimispora saccharolytica]MCF2657088.1 hypothetical protein [Lacrimispora saccharolytica]